MTSPNIRVHLDNRGPSWSVRILGVDRISNEVMPDIVKACERMSWAESTRENNHWSMATHLAKRIIHEKACCGQEHFQIGPFSVAGHLGTKRQAWCIDSILRGAS